jgi:amidase
MPTTGGALVFAGYVPPYEATLVTNLRNAGAIIIAKTGMTELANWVAGSPSPMPTNYNAVAGYGFNPYDPHDHDWPFDGRPALNAGRSSSGIGTQPVLAGNVSFGNLGLILSPSNQNMLAGVKPTVRPISVRAVPIVADQDARTDGEDGDQPPSAGKPQGAAGSADLRLAMHAVGSDDYHRS